MGALDVVDGLVEVRVRRVCALVCCRLGLHLVVVAAVGGLGQRAVFEVNGISECLQRGHVSALVDERNVEDLRLD